ncbi:hypothetical protein EIP86_000173 [Pleurotus ostreatoroseus]|nr:hypothetical protein EIP86_000173 [Pleurotus ostreatoroseus]
MESSRQAAHEAMKDAIAQLERVVPTAKLDEPLTLNAVTPYPQTLQSTFGREGIQLEESFGFAPSTLVHQGSDAPLGKPKM